MISAQNLRMCQQFVLEIHVNLTDLYQTKAEVNDFCKKLHIVFMQHRRRKV